MTISVVVPAYNEEKYIGACLQSLLENAPNAFLEIIVVDNASTDGTARVAKQFPGVRVVPEPKKGLTQARQRGLLEAQGTHIAYLDADTRLSPSWLRTVRKNFAANPNLVALSGPYDYDDLPVWQRTLVLAYWQFLAMPASWITGYVLVGGNFIARKDSLREIGGFDTTIAFYGEDTNIARRLHAIGKIRFDRKFLIFTSGRRIVKEGLLKTAWTYVLNYLSEVILKKPVTGTYTDIR